MVVEEFQTATPPSDDSSDASSLSSEAYDSINGNLSKSLGILVIPAVRNYAKQCGININDIHGTGEDGRVRMQDVINYIANIGKSMEPLASSCANFPEEFLVKKESILHKLKNGHQFEDKTITLRRIYGRAHSTAIIHLTNLIPLGFQRAMVKTMTMAAKVPHFHYLEEINCDALVDLKEAFQNKNSDPGHRNIGIAMATPYGLVVPNLEESSIPINPGDNKGNFTVTEAGK